MPPQQISCLQAYLNKVKKLSKKPVYQKALLEQQQKKVSNEQQVSQFNENEQMIQINQEEQKNNKQNQSEKKNDLHLGFEFQQNIKSEMDLINFIIEKQYYLASKYMTPEQIQEFSSVFNNIDIYDERNIGSIVGMTMLGFIGFVALGFTVVGVIAGGVLGVVMGRYAGKRIKRKQKKKKFVELDVFEIKIRCYIKWTRVQIIKYKHNINQLRFIIERLFFELKPALHYRKFAHHQQLQIREVMKKIIKLMKQPEVTSGLILTFKLCQEQLKLLQMTSNQEIKAEISKDHKIELEVSLLKSLDNVLKPFVFLIDDFKIKKGQLKVLQQEIFKFLIDPAIIQLSNQCPDPTMSLEFIRMFAEKMKVPVNNQNLQAYLKDQNYQDIENLTLLIGKEGKNLYQNQTQLEKVVEIYNEDDEQSLQQYQNKKKNYEIDIKNSFRKSEKQSMISYNNNNNNFEIPQEQQISIIKPEKSSQGEYKASIQQHPNIIMNQLIERSGDNDILNASPLKMFQHNQKENKNEQVELEIPHEQKFQQDNKQELKSQNIQFLILPQKECNSEEIISNHQQVEENLNNASFHSGQEIIQIRKNIKDDIKSNYSASQFQNQIYDSISLLKFQLFHEMYYESLEGWQQVTNKDQIYIYKTMKPGKGSVFVRGNAFLKDVKKIVAIKAICDQEFRRAWFIEFLFQSFRDKILTGFRIVETYDEYTDAVFYYVCSPVPIVSPREFLQKRVKREDYPEAGQTTMLYYSIEHSGQQVIKGHVRAQTELASYVFEQLEDGTRISFLSNNDVKGSVPKVLVNYASAKAPFTWFGNLRKACLQYQQHDGDLKKIKIK